MGINFKYQTDKLKIKIGINPRNIKKDLDFKKFEEESDKEIGKSNQILINRIEILLNKAERFKLIYNFDKVIENYEKALNLQRGLEPNTGKEAKILNEIGLIHEKQ